MKSVPVEQVIWLAGLLEGEGSFMMKEHGGGRASLTKSPRAAVAMNDEDVIAQVASIWQRAYYSKQPPKAYPHWNVQYVTEIRGAGAIDVMHAILPYMFRRRKAKIDEIIAEFESWPSEFERRSAAMKLRFAK